MVEERANVIMLVADKCTVWHRVSGLESSVVRRRVRTPTPPPSFESDTKGL